MSIKLMSEVWSKSRYRGEKLLILLAIADAANEANGLVAWPGYDFIAKKCRITKSYTIKLIAGMCEAEKPEVEITEHGGGRRSNHYKIIEENLGAVEDKTSGEHVFTGVHVYTPEVNTSTPQGYTPVHPNHNSNRNGNITLAEEKPAPSEPSIPAEPSQVLAEKSRIVAALQRSSPPLDHSGLNVLDVSKYPEDIKPVVIKVCQLWNLRPPNGKDKSYWIEAGRELLDACGEFGPGLLDKVRADFVSYMEAHQGIPQFTVAGPKSLVNSARAAAGLKRGGQSILPGVDYIDPDEQYNREPSRSRR